MGGAASCTHAAAAQAALYYPKPRRPWRVANKLVKIWGLVFMLALPFLGVVLPVWFLSLFFGV
jgi:uncharacterized membrane protein YadS